MHGSSPFYVCTTLIIALRDLDIDVPSLLGRLEARLNDPDVQGRLLGGDLDD